MTTLLSVLLKLGGGILTVLGIIWKNPKLRVPLLVLIGIGGLLAGGKIWLDNHDAGIINDNNAKWEKRIADSKKTTIDTSYRTQQLPATHQTQEARPITSDGNLNPAGIGGEYVLGPAMTVSDSLWRLLTEPVMAVFEDTMSIDTVRYYPLGKPPRQITLDKHPKIQQIPVITITETSILMNEPDQYKRFQWFNSRVHADLYPFTTHGILGGFSASLCTYGLSKEQKDMIFYLPMIGLATDTKNVLVGTFGARWNISHHIGLFQDTHIIVVYTTGKQVLIGIGTTL